MNRQAGEADDDEVERRNGTKNRDKKYPITNGDRKLEQKREEMSDLYVRRDRMIREKFKKEGIEFEEERLARSD